MIWPPCAGGEFDERKVVGRGRPVMSVPVCGGRAVAKLRARECRVRAVSQDLCRVILNMTGTCPVSLVSFFTETAVWKR